MNPAGPGASVCGGLNNEASGYYSSVLGGNVQDADSYYSTAY